MRPFTIPIKRRPSIVLHPWHEGGLRSTCGAPAWPPTRGAYQAGARRGAPARCFRPRPLTLPRSRRPCSSPPCGTRSSSPSRSPARWALCLRRNPAAPYNGLPRSVFLLVLSYYFYASWNWRYLPLIFGSSTVDFFLARAIAREPRPHARRVMLAITVALNLGFLGFFKYWNFALENVHLLAAALHGGAPPPAGEALQVLLPPVGISFFTFESMSYVIDVYRGELSPHRSYLRYLLFVAFFPHLVAGPIVRPRDLLPQLERQPRRSPAPWGARRSSSSRWASSRSSSSRTSSRRTSSIGSSSGRRASRRSRCSPASTATPSRSTATSPATPTSPSARRCSSACASRENFDAPYQAENLADFWRRWHISLSTWLRDYLYIPLGGSRGRPWLTYRNLMITMVLGGLWHGASWTFVFWGFLHGLGLGVTRAWERWRQRRGGATGETTRGLAARAAGVFFTFHYVCLAWIFFRAPTFKQALLILKQLATLTTFHPNLPPLVLVAILLTIGLVSHYTPRAAYDRSSWRSWSCRRRRRARCSSRWPSCSTRRRARWLCRSSTSSSDLRAPTRAGAPSWRGGPGNTRAWVPGGFSPLTSRVSHGAVPWRRAHVGGPAPASAAPRRGCIEVELMDSAAPLRRLGGY